VLCRGYVLYDINRRFFKKVNRSVHNKDSAVRKSSKIVLDFAVAVSLIAIAGYSCIHAGGLRSQVVAPAIGLLVTISVGIFARYYNAALKAESAPMQVVATSTYADEQPAGFTFLRIVSISALCVGGLLVLSFIIQALRGTLNLADVRRFIPKGIYGTMLFIYVLRRTTPKS
jgi:hypothetical protein